MAALFQFEHVDGGTITINVDNVESIEPTDDGSIIYFVSGRTMILPGWYAHDVIDQIKDALDDERRRINREV